jgi:hypothetical protein
MEDRNLRRAHVPVQIDEAALTPVPVEESSTQYPPGAVEWFTNAGAAGVPSFV